jgi:hypothetical protein
LSETSSAPRVETSGKFGNPASPADWPPRAPELTTWPLWWRARWGTRANELEAAGEPWPRAERTAFTELVAARIAAGLPPGVSLAEAEADRQAVESVPAPPAPSSSASSRSPRCRPIAPTMFDRRPAEVATALPDGPSAVPSTDRPPPAVEPATDAIGAPATLPATGLSARAVKRGDVVVGPEIAEETGDDPLMGEIVETARLYGKKKGWALFCPDDWLPVWRSVPKAPPDAAALPWGGHD